MKALCPRLCELPGIEVEFIDQPSGLRAVDFGSDMDGTVPDTNEETNDCKQKENEKDSLEFMLEEQSRNQIRSDYRRSLGSENRRRYLE